MICPRYAGVQSCRGKVRLFGQEIEVEEEFADGALSRVCVLLPARAEGVSVELKIGRKKYSVRDGALFYGKTEKIR